MAKEKKKSAPESVDEGVVRDNPKETPMDQVSASIDVKFPGKWVKATVDEVSDYEKKGVLLGFDKKKMEVLIKE